MTDTATHSHTQEIFPLHGQDTFFGVGVVHPDGSVHEFGGRGRVWKSRAAFHRDRAGREANLILYFPREDHA